MKKILLFTMILAGCAPKSIESYHTAENEEEVVRLLNQREFGKAVFLIESREGKTPADKNMAFLLGQAYLGKAGFEPLAVAAKVAEPQPSSSEASVLFPACSQGPLGPMKEADPLCLLKRVYLQLPDADLEEFTRARQLFRYAYPDPAAAPEWVNVLIGAVETASVVKRAGKIYLLAKQLGSERRTPQDEELRWLVRQAKRVLDEAAQSLARAEHSGKKISQLLTGSRETVWFDRAKGAIGWADRLGLGTFFDLLRAEQASPDDEAKYGAVLDKIRALLEEEEKALSN